MSARSRLDLPLLPGGRRLDWEQLPAELGEGLPARLGSPVIYAATQPGGFSPGLAARLQLADGRGVFVKAAGPDPNPTPRRCTGPRPKSPPPSLRPRPVPACCGPTTATAGWRWPLR